MGVVRDMAVGPVMIGGRLRIHDEAAAGVLDLLSGEGERHDLECAWCTRLPVTTRVYFVRCYIFATGMPDPWYKRRLCAECRTVRGGSLKHGLYEFSEERPADA